MEEWEIHLDWSEKNGDSPNPLSGRCPMIAVFGGISTADVFIMPRSHIIARAKELAKTGTAALETAAWGYACATQCHNPSAIDCLMNNRSKVIQWLKTH